MEEILEEGDKKSLLTDTSLTSQYNLRSEMAQEIISRQPGFIENWSLLIFLAILLIMLASTWFVQYPDIVTSKAVLTAKNSPKGIIVRQEGLLTRLFVKNNQKIEQNDVIGWIGSLADPDEVLQLSKMLDEYVQALNKDDSREVLRIVNKKFTRLGELQQPYQEFLTSKDIFKDYNQTRDLLRLHQQRMIFQHDLHLIKSQVSDWVKRHVLKAPITGRMSLMNSAEENSYLQTGILLGYVIPDNTKYYAEMMLSQNNFGKIDTGLRVQLRFEAYPYEEWGFIEGTIDYISNVSSADGFLATIRLDNGLITNNRKRLTYKNGLKAQAIIITKDMRLLQRFYYGFIKSTSIEK